MKVLELALAGALLAALTCTASAQDGMYGNAGGMPGAYAGGPSSMGYAQAMPSQSGYSAQPLPSQMGAMQGSPQQMAYLQAAGYPQAMPGGYNMSSADAQQALYGPATPVNGDPLPMNGGDGGMGSGPGCGCGPNQAQCYDDETTHYAYGSAEVFYARRNNSVIKQPVIIDTNTGLPAAGTADTEFRYLPGIKAAAGYMFKSGIGVETDFWGQWGFASRKTINGADNLSVPGDLGLSSLNFFDVDQITETYSSHINNYEINFVLPYASIQYLAGFRYLTVDERFDISTFSNTTGSGDYQIITRNRMYGGQLGARGQWQVERFVFDVEAKAGVFANAAHQDQNVVDASGFPLRTASGDERVPSFVGELSSYLFIPMGSHFTGRLGYTAVWIDELALAPNQLDFTDTATSGSGINARRGMLIHGFNAGLEARW
jgi:Putative beta barrel porin-7 (BBP7)